MATPEPDFSFAPGEIAARRFNRSRHGYNPQEVEAFLHLVAQQVESMGEQLRAALDRLEELEPGGGRAGEAAYARLAKDFAAVVRAAEEVMDRLREEAEGEARATVAAAHEEADRVIAAAKADAERLFSLARTKAESSMEAVRREAARLLESAQLEATERGPRVTPEPGAVPAAADPPGVDPARDIEAAPGPAGGQQRPGGEHGASIDRSGARPIERAGNESTAGASASAPSPDDGAVTRTVEALPPESTETSPRDTLSTSIWGANGQARADPDPDEQGDLDFGTFIWGDSGAPSEE